MLNRRKLIQMSGFAPVCLCNLPTISFAAGEIEPHVCTELIIQDIGLAYDIAIDENPANDPELNGLPRSEAISLFSKKWNPKRRILNISFVTEPAFIDTVIEMARGWEPYIGMQFVFGNSDPDILIAFDAGGSWSYLGTDSRYYSSRGRPSMNFGWFHAGTEITEFSRTTLHEFGHALSLVHEHSHPTGEISWKKEEVYKYYQNHGWDKDKVDSQIFRKYRLSQVNGSDYDNDSIMHYPIPRELVSDPGDAVGWNTKLSTLDKATIENVYPKPDGLLPG